MVKKQIVITPHCYIEDSNDLYVKNMLLNEVAQEMIDNTDYMFDDLGCEVKKFQIK